MAFPSSPTIWTRCWRFAASGPPLEGAVFAGVVQPWRFAAADPVAAACAGAERAATAASMADGRGFADRQAEGPQPEFPRAVPASACRALFVGRGRRDRTAPPGPRVGEGSAAAV